MASYSTVHLVPAEDLGWIPDRAFLERLFQYLGATQAWFVSGYPQALLLDDPDEYMDILAEPVLEQQNVPLADALSLCEEHRPVVCSYGLTCEEFGRRIYDELMALPEEVRHDFAPWEVGVTVGPFHVPSSDEETNLGPFSFEVRLSGYRMPYLPWEEYARLARATPALGALASWLEEQAGGPFQVLVSSSY